MYHSKTQTIIDEICQKLHCSELAEDLGKVNHARELLAQLQHQEIFKNLHANTANNKLKRTKSFGMHKISNIFLQTQQRLDMDMQQTSSSSNRDGDSINTLEENQLLAEEDNEMENSLQYHTLSEDSWLGYFRGYEVMEENQEIFSSENNKQCIELTLEEDSHSIENYLRAGIRCFMIDLFIGTEFDKQKLIFKLRESELKVSREYGFPITTTLFAMLSPRLQYTGVMETNNPTQELKTDSTIVLTTKKKYSYICSCKKVYVNACFLIEDCRIGDFILVGPFIQLMVTEVLSEELICLVKEAGILSSRLPVRFPARCRRQQLSVEELEGITFAREVGINVLVSYKPGTPQYLNELYAALRLLKCDKLRILTRLTLNDYVEEQHHDLDWIAESYDGFFIDFNYAQNDSKCFEKIEQENLLSLSSAAVSFMDKIFQLNKPIILNPQLIAQRRLFVQPYNVPQIYYYPDKFIFSKKNYNNAFFFYQLQNALSASIPLKELSLHLFCEQSELGDDAIARACVAASYQCQAKAILVCSAWPDMSIKLSHFRPQAAIYHISEAKSIGEYISLHHHINFMHFQLHNKPDYAKYVTNGFIFCLAFLNSRNMLHAGENIIFVFGSQSVTTLCDKYLVYKFNENNFANKLENILFA